MNGISGSGKKVFIEIQLSQKRFNFRTGEWAYLQLWNEGDFIGLLQDRTGKSKAEVRRLLESYRRSIQGPKQKRKTAPKVPIVKSRAMNRGNSASPLAQC